MTDERWVQCPAVLDLYADDRCELQEGHHGRHTTSTWGPEITWDERGRVGGRR